MIAFIAGFTVNLLLEIRNPKYSNTNFHDYIQYYDNHSNYTLNTKDQTVAIAIYGQNDFEEINKNFRV